MWSTLTSVAAMVGSGVEPGGSTAAAQTARWCESAGVRRGAGGRLKLIRYVPPAATRSRHPQASRGLTRIGTLVPSAVHFIRGSATQAYREHDSRRRHSIHVVRLKGRQSRALARSRSMSTVPYVTSVVGMNRAPCSRLCQRFHPSPRRFSSQVTMLLQGVCMQCQRGNH
jgi:hypothetical protein